MFPPRSIVHLDADAFFVSVEQAADARLRGKAVAVGGERRGIIASASYEARKMGVYTPMPTARARQLCPKLIVLPGDYERYEQFSKWMFAYAFDFTPEVEVTGIDEGYFDLSGARRPAVEIARIVRQAIGQKLKISVSEGVGSSKLVSQIASKLRKPNAFIEVPPGQELDFLHPLPNKWLPGVGPLTSRRLDAAGLRDIRHLAHTPVELLELLLGSQAASVREHANGIDERPLIVTREAPKSFGSQETFFTDLTDEAYVEAVLRRMADRLMAKVREEGKSIRTLTVKVRYNDFSEDQRSESLTEPTDLETDIYSKLGPMLRLAWRRRVSLRLVSLKLSHIYNGYRQQELTLDDRPDISPARRNLARTVDALRQRLGEGVILRSHDLRLREGPQDAAAGKAAPSRRRVTYPEAKSAPEKKREGEGGGLAILSDARNLRAVPLNVRSWYSFLDSTLSPAAIVELAVRHELKAVALTDIGNLHGAPGFFQKAKAAGIQAIIGAELRIGGHSLLCYVQEEKGYHNLCRLLTRGAAPLSPSGRMSATADKGDGNAGSREGFDSGDGDESVAARQRLPVAREKLHGLTDGLLAVSDDASLAEFFPGRFYFAASSARAAIPRGLPAVLAPRVHYAAPGDRLKWNIMQSIRTRTLLPQSHPDKRLTGAFHFRSPAEMRRLAGDFPEFLANTLDLAERCRDFEFPFGSPQFPAWVQPGFPAEDIPEYSSETLPLTNHEFLSRLVLTGLKKRYGNEAPKHEEQVREELAIIAEVGYEDYFLIVWDLLQDCRRAGIEWITRGSAADSLVCYCLEISGVCPIRFDLYFKRFLNKDRMAMKKLPDVDLDFPHDRKDDVVGLLFAKYGPSHCAAVGGFSTFHARGAVGEVAKVLGLSEYQTRRFTEGLPSGFGGGWTPAAAAMPETGAALLEKLKTRPESADLPLMEEPYRTAVLMADFLDGCPRYPKMHPCGIVLSKQPMVELTPGFISRKNCLTTHYDMDAVEDMGLVKMDILAQGGLSVMRDVRHSLATRGITVDLEALKPWDDPAVWSLIASGSARAVHHIESPAMISLCSMVDVNEIDGLIAIVSVIRPGAANEDKKMAFTRRYRGDEARSYPHPSLEKCLHSTFGLIVYEEHILQIADSFAGMNPGRADVLRRALVREKRDELPALKEDFVRCARKIYDRDEDSIEKVWELVTSFNGYAFNKAHSTAYGVEAYQAAWLKRYYPADFMAAVLTNGKGFYGPLVYILECHRLGLKFLPPCIHDPGPGFMVRGSSGDAIRVPVSTIKGLTGETTARLLHARQSGKTFTTLADFHETVHPSPAELELLIRAGACDGLGLTRTRLFWEAQVCRRRQQERESPDSSEAGRIGQIRQAGQPAQGWLLAPPVLEFDTATQPPLAEPSRHDRLLAEHELFGYTVSGHPLELHEDIAWETYCPVDRLAEFTGKRVVLCGLTVVSRVHSQTDGAAMKFMTLADRTGMIEAELFGATYRRFGLATVRYPVLEVTATVEPFENGNGFTLRVHRAGRPRKRVHARPAERRAPPRT